MIRERIQMIQYSPVRDAIIGCGTRGGIFVFSHDLQLIQQSQSTMYPGAISALTLNDENIFTRDIFGNIIRWDLHTLHPIDVLLTEEIKDSSTLHEDDCASPAPTHGLHLHGKYLYTNNAYGQILEVEIEGMKVNRILDPHPESFIENFQFSGPDVDILSDFAGNLLFGNIETGEFSKKKFLSPGPIHRVAYDKRHNRYWSTNEYGNGIYILRPDGETEEYLFVAEDDMEWVDFNDDYSLAYVVTFDRHLYLYNNIEKKPTLQRVVGPFKFHLYQVLHVTDDHVYCLLSSGEIYRVNRHGSIVNSIDFEGNCAWGLDVHPTQKHKVYLSLEDGSVSIVNVQVGNFASIELNEESRFVYGFGRIRRINVLPDSSFIGGAADGTVFRANQKGEILWYKRILGCVRDLDVNIEQTKVLVGTEGKYAIEFSVENGDILREFKMPQAVWAVQYDRSGNLWIGERRKKVKIFNPDGEMINEINFVDNTKNLRLMDNGNILFCGPEGIAELSSETFKIEKRWNDWMTSTCEDAVEHKGFVYGFQYSSCITTYRYDDENGECIDKVANLSDFPKKVCIIEIGDSSILLVAGRSPYVSAYRLQNGHPHKVRELYLHNYK